MNKKDVLAEEVNQILSQSFWGKSGVSLKEDTQPVLKEVETQKEDSKPIVEQHVCPLCESSIEQDISDDKLTEHISMIVDIINEMDNITEEELESISEEFPPEMIKMKKKKKNKDEKGEEGEEGEDDDEEYPSKT